MKERLRLLGWIGDGQPNVTPQIHQNKDLSANKNMNQNGVEYVDLDLASSFSLILSCGWPHLASTRLCAEGVFSSCPLPCVHYGNKACIEVLPAHR